MMCFTYEKEIHVNHNTQCIILHGILSSAWQKSIRCELLVCNGTGIHSESYFEFDFSTLRNKKNLVMFSLSRYCDSSRVEDNRSHLLSRHVTLNHFNTYLPLMVIIGDPLSWQPDSKDNRKHSFGFVNHILPDNVNYGLQVS